MNVEHTRAPYTPVEAVNEAKRCLQCDDPYCNQGCPAEIDVRAFVSAVATGNLTAAARALRQKNVLPLSCAMICPVERQCQERCRSSNLLTPISVARIQRFVAEQDIEQHLYQPPKTDPKGIKVAVVGSGPAGLAAATELACRGYDVTVFERAETPGGMLRNGIPDYRLDKDDLDRELDYVKEIGFEIRCGETVESIDALLDDGFEAVLLAVGLWRSARLGIPGEDLDRVHHALDFLQTYASAPDAASFPLAVGNRVLAIGGGSVAMDAACSALRVGAEKAEIVCLESPVEMPGTREEIARAWEEGIIFHSRVKPLRILGEDGKVTGFEGIRIEWKDPDSFVPSNAVEMPGTEFKLQVDTVIVAIGQAPDDTAQQLTEGLDTERGRLKVDPETYTTSRERVFAAGDIIAAGGATVVRSVCEGKNAASAIDAYLSAKRQ